jgi:hypothetical protein
MKESQDILSSGYDLLAHALVLSLMENNFFHLLFICPIVISPPLC